MYEPNPVTDPPPDPDTELWRYMSLSKLVSMVTSSTLWFSRADLLGDPHEAAMGLATRQQREQLYEVLAADGMPADMVQANLEREAQRNRDMVPSYCVSCWHAHQGESAAMWATYGGLDAAVAVRTTFERLTASIVDDRPILAGLVTYIDYATTPLPRGEPLQAIFHKQLTFAHEKELRAVLWDARQLWDDTHVPVTGYAVKVDLTRLLDAIRVGPAVESWFLDAVTACMGRLGVEVPVTRSELVVKPVY